VKTLTDIISCPCYNTQFYYRRVCEISILWWWCIIRNSTLYINRVRSCCKSLLPPFTIMNYSPCMYLVFDLWKGRKCMYLECTPWLIVISEGGWVVSATLPTRSAGCTKFCFPAHPYHSISGFSRLLYGSLQFTSKEMSMFYCWKHLALSTCFSFPWPIQSLFYFPLSLSLCLSVLFPF